MGQRNQALGSMQKSTTVLAVESSCDDSSLCLLRGHPGSQLHSQAQYQIIDHISFSQEEILAPWGGVVPEIAARNHLIKLPMLVSKIIDSHFEQLQSLDLIAVTNRPGLLGPLLTGLNLAKTLSLYFEKPIFAANHLEAHLEAIHLTQDIHYPYLGLILSGGHTAIMRVHGPAEFELLSSTIDDAAGEALDKGGKLMGLPYPAGKWIDQFSFYGHGGQYSFPQKIMSSRPDCLSYSGLKNALRLQLEKNNFPSPTAKDQHPSEQFQNLYNLCHDYIHAICAQIIEKIRSHLRQNEALVIGGGVACSRYLRNKIQEEKLPSFFVAPQFCTDNAAMIALNALRNHQYTAYPHCLNLSAQSRAITKVNHSL